VITLAELCAIMPYARKRAVTFLDHLNAAMVEFEINNPLREAAFLAQVAHESGELRYVRELASGADYDVGRKAVALGNTPEDDGDGERYKGRGLIQLTGVANYRECSAALFGDPDALLDRPERLEDPEVACRSAAWFWNSRGLNALADKGDFLRITKLINGGTTHYKERVAYYERAKQLFASEAM
jgi:putative chitinase